MKLSCRKKDKRYNDFQVQMWMGFNQFSYKSCSFKFSKLLAPVSSVRRSKSSQGTCISPMHCVVTSSFWKIHVVEFFNFPSDNGHFWVQEILNKSEYFKEHHIISSSYHTINLARIDTPFHEQFLYWQIQCLGFFLSKFNLKIIMFSASNGSFVCLGRPFFPGR